MHEHEHETQARTDEVLGVPSTVNERSVMHKHEAQARIDEPRGVRLYTVTSTVAEYRGHKDVALNWFVRQRRVPAYPFTQEVSGHGFKLPWRLAVALVDHLFTYSFKDYWYPEDALNQMFALDEAEMLAEYLRGCHGGEPAIHEEELPIECGRRGPGAIDAGGGQGFYMLDKTPGYPLSFEAWGYYDLRVAEGPYSDPVEEERYAIPAPYVGEGDELLNTLDGERQQIAHALGAEHPLFKLVDGALRSGDIDELRTALAAAAGWPSDGWEGDWEFPGDVCEVDGEETPR